MSAGAGQDEASATWQTARAQVPGTLISDYCYRPAGGSPRELIVLLHGYQQFGKHLMDKLAACCPDDAAILAPNAPYPLPERKGDGSYRLGFSWYFYNPAMDDYYIDMKVALELLQGIVAQLGYESLPKRFVGFSQGGYLAPFAALLLGNARQVVGVASEYLPEEIDLALRKRGGGWPVPFRVDSIHGAQDEIVPLADAKKGHSEMLAKGSVGELIALEGEGHRLTPAFQAALRGLLARVTIS